MASDPVLHVCQLAPRLFLFGFEGFTQVQARGLAQEMINHFKVNPETEDIQILSFAGKLDVAQLDENNEIIKFIRSTVEQYLKEF